MKTVILCGGYGTRLSEETKIKPKPMVKIGKEPILEHVINIYKDYNFTDFVLALGYKSEYIKSYYNKKNKKNIDLVYTGKDTMTGGRLLRLKNYLKNEETFMLTYGDGVSSVNIKKLLEFHKKHKKIATLTAVRPPVRFGELKIQGSKINSFQEKPQVTQSWINGGFFVLNKEIFNLIKNDKIMLEREPMEKLAKMGQLMAYKHEGFWQCMDTLRDKIFLNKLIKSKSVPWKRNKF
jgi:glucose-1-phosphate cytidylyltransferase